MLCPHVGELVKRQGQRYIWVMSKDKNLPSVSGDADGTVMISAGKYARNAVLTAFEMIGGVPALAEWAENNKTDFYTKIFTKTITRESEVTKSDGVEGMLEALDNGAIDCDFEEVVEDDENE